MGYDFSAFKDVPVLVTGATGFVGGHLAERLLALGARVRLLVRSPESERAQQFQKKGAELVQGDITDSPAVDRAVTGCTYVFHLAALFREAKFPDEYYYRVNVDGTENVLRAAERHGVTRVVYCSTNGVHGTVGDTPADETAPFAPCDEYQKSKCESEDLVQRFIKSSRTEVVVLRPAMIWGEGDTRILKLFRGVARRRMPIIGSGRTWTHWIYVEDLVDAFLLAARTSGVNGRAYLIAGRKPVLLKDVYAAIAKRAGVTVLPIGVPVLPLQLLGSLVEAVCRPFGVEPPIYRRRVDFFIKNRHFSIKKAQRELGFEPQLSFEDELDRTFSWYQRQGWI